MIHALRRNVWTAGASELGAARPGRGDRGPRARAGEGAHLARPQPQPIKMPYTQDWLEAAEMAGSPIIESTEARGEPRDTVWEANLMGDDQGRRYDSAYAYLRPAMEGTRLPLLPLLRACAPNISSCHAPLCAANLTVS